MILLKIFLNDVLLFVYKHYNLFKALYSKESCIMFVNKKKDSLIQIRVNEDQKKIIKEMANKEGKSVSEFLLMLVAKHYEDTQS